MVNVKARSCRLFFYALAAWAFAWIHATMGTEPMFAHMSALASFNRSAHIVFQSRILLPAAANVLVRVFPFSNLAIFVFLEALAVFFTLVSFRSFLVLFFRRGVDFLVPSIFLPLAFNYIILDRHYLASDLANVCLFTAGLAAMLRRRWWAYYPIFVLGALNRETIAFLPIALLFVSFGRTRWQNYVPHIAVSVLLWIVIKAGLAQALSGYPGVYVEYHFFDNVRFMLGVLRLQPEPLSKVLAFGGVWLLIPFGWRALTPTLKRLLLVAIPFLLLIMALPVISETRVLGELIPIVMASGLYVAASWEPAAQLLREEEGWELTSGAERHGLRYVTGITIGAVAFAIFCGVALRLAQARNLFPNPSFEAERLDWTGNMVKFARSSDRAFHGGFAAHAVTAGLQYESSGDVAVDPGRCYSLDAMVYCQKGAARIYLENARTNKVIAGAQLYPHEGWSRLSVSTPAAIGTDRVRVGLDDYHEISDYYVDSIRLMHESCH